MTLKDWKKVNEEKKNIWWNKVPYRRYGAYELQIYKNEGNTWSVKIMDNGEILERIRVFKTKSQALKYAKSYMRTH